MSNNKEDIGVTLTENNTFFSWKNEDKSFILYPNKVRRVPFRIGHATLKVLFTVPLRLN